MTKTLKDFYEVYKPQSPDEQRFIDKHVVAKHSDPTGNGDEVFKASKVKYAKRKKERHGYDSGADEAVYEGMSANDAAKYRAAGERRKKYEIAKNWLGHEDLGSAAKSRTPAEHKARHKELLKTIDKFPKGHAIQYFAKNAANSYKSLYLESADEAVKQALEMLDEDTVYYKHFKITSGPKVSGAREGGLEHVQGATKKLGKLGVPTQQGRDYHDTKHITITNTRNGNVTHHHVYQSDWSHSRPKPTISVRSIGNKRDGQEEHHNVLKHYLAGKIKIKEDSDWTVDELDLLGEALELLEQVDVDAANELQELSRKTLGNYVNAATDSLRTNTLWAARTGDRESKAIARKRYKGMYKAVNKLAKEETQIDELSRKTLGSYAKQAQDDIEGYASSGKRISDLAADTARAGDKEAAKHYGAMAADRYRKAANRASGAKLAIDKLTKEEVINRAAERFAPAPTTSLAERFAMRLEGVSESNANLLNGLFASLNEDNQKSMIEVASTPRGVADLIDFAIQNRGE